MRLLIVTLLIIVLLCQLLLTVNKAEQHETVTKIGVIAPLSGPFAEWGESVLNGALLAAELSDFPIEIIPEDGACTPSKIIRAGNALLSRGVKIIVGPGCGTGMGAMATIAKNYNALLLSPGLLSEELLNEFDNVINIATQYSLETKVLAEHISKRGAKSVAIVHGSNLFGEEHARTLKLFFKDLNVDVALSLRTSLDDRDFRPIAARIVQANPDAVYIHQSEYGLGLLAKQLREANYKGLLFSNYGSENETSKTIAVNYLNGLEYTFPLATRNSDEKQQRIKNLYIERFNREPVASSLFVFDSVLRLKPAITTCENKSLKCIKDEYLKPGFSGISGEWELKQNGESIRHFGIKKIENNQFEWVN